MPSTLHLHPLTTTATTTTTVMDSTPAVAQPTMAAAEVLPSFAEELARELATSCRDPLREMATVAKHHNHKVGPHQCCSAAVRRIPAPLSTVWSLVRRFDQPQAYKLFLRSCRVIAGDGGNVGCLREVLVVSGLPAASSTERLEVLDDNNHAIGFRVVGGEHRLQNYRSVTTLHPTSCGGDDGSEEEEGTVVVESYVVDVPPGNTKEETCTFVDTIDHTCSLFVMQ
ncbi:hypothetical protein Cgig2_021042 [Carnegiea gigantea]|uniref:Uncharacterized protein n=1 Tax=Carnegiea gigantea TaxID=171969 RepID=A0A9Q1GWK8_9CARY|nr:hypothetical protein Cgig2_021042 [Carnegiea gigantea]